MNFLICNGARSAFRQIILCRNPLQADTCIPKPEYSLQISTHTHTCITPIQRSMYVCVQLSKYLSNVEPRMDGYYLFTCSANKLSANYLYLCFCAVLAYRLIHRHAYIHFCYCCYEYAYVWLMLVLHSVMFSFIYLHTHTHTHTHMSMHTIIYQLTFVCLFLLFTCMSPLFIFNLNQFNLFSSFAFNILYPCRFFSLLCCICRKLLTLSCLLWQMLFTLYNISQKIKYKFFTFFFFRFLKRNNELMPLQLVSIRNVSEFCSVIKFWR